MNFCKRCAKLIEGTGSSLCAACAFCGNEALRDTYEADAEAMGNGWTAEQLFVSVADDDYVDD